MFAADCRNRRFQTQVLIQIRRTRRQITTVLACATVLAGFAMTNTSQADGLKTWTESSTKVNKPKARSNYNGPRASIAVLGFTDETGNRHMKGGTGEAMARQLTSALVQTRRFRVVSRRKMDKLMQEIDFGQSGAVEPGSAARFGRMAGARLVITGAVTAFEESGGTRKGGGGALFGKDNKLGNLIGILGQSQNTTYMAVNLEVIDVETSEIVDSVLLDAEVRDAKAIIGGIIGPLAGGLQGWGREPRGKALSIILNDSVEYLSYNVPEGYYTQAPAGKSVVARTAPAPNEDVKMSQQVLQEYGLYSGAIDGLMGPQTRDGIRIFQEQMGLRVTGDLDERTVNALGQM